MLLSVRTRRRLTLQSLISSRFIMTSFLLSETRAIGFSSFPPLFFASCLFLFSFLSTRMFWFEKKQTPKRESSPVAFTLEHSKKILFFSWLCSFLLLLLIRKHRRTSVVECPPSHRPPQVQDTTSVAIVMPLFNCAFPHFLLCHPSSRRTKRRARLAESPIHSVSGFSACVCMFSRLHSSLSPLN